MRTEGDLLPLLSYLSIPVTEIKRNAIDWFQVYFMSDNESFKSIFFSLYFLFAE